MDPIKKRAILYLVIVAAGYSLLSIAVRLMNNGLEPLTQVYLRIGLGVLVASIVFSRNFRVKEVLGVPEIIGALLIVSSVYFANKVVEG